MAIDTKGTVRMRGEDSGSELPVRVQVDDDRIRLLAGQELVGDWNVREIGISALHDGFVIRAEGEEFILKAVDDARLAEELGLAAATPRMARKVAALHNQPEVEPERRVDVVAEPRSDALALAFALGGGLVMLGGAFLRIGQDTESATAEIPSLGGVEFWLVFVIAGALMVAVAYLMSSQRRGAQVSALVIVAGVVVFFGWLAGRADADTRPLTAYGFIVGGLVVGVAVLFSGATRDSE